MYVLLMRISTLPYTKHATKRLWSYFCHQIKAESILFTIEYRSDDVTKTFLHFQCFKYHISVEHDEKTPQPKFGGNRFTGARDRVA